MRHQPIHCIEHFGPLGASSDSDSINRNYAVGMSVNFEDVLGSIGKNLLVRLERYLELVGVEIFTKLKALNQRGWSKDRPELKILAKGRCFDSLCSVSVFGCRRIEKRKSCAFISDTKLSKSGVEETSRIELDEFFLFEEADGGVLLEQRLGLAS